ncbi:branched-chain amino acid ABC transporter ATP-binding protein/permease [Bradyrhizobium tropiciagri]|nr:branched-chain amino acid ABC transporter ATP-binding protein/permease [Bradyrhizobium tropiciagri]MBR0873316.1 branched-chain amino acid ABC transporter ATP-binding protein/permease [Bradyrhizobium tropiciagri]
MGRGRALALACVLLAIPLLPVSEFWITVGNFIGISALTALGLVLLTGAAGITSFGQAAFVGLGAYTTAYLTIAYGVSPWLGLMAGLAITAVAAVVLGLLTMRLSGHFLPLGTLAWGLALYFLFGNLEALGKYDGLIGIPPIYLGTVPLDTGRKVFWLIWAIVLVSTMLLENLLASRPGRALRALKQSEALAGSMGVDAGREKLKAFIVAALLASVAGWLFAHMQRTVNPTPFSATASIEYLLMSVIGGLGSVWGALLGAGAVLLLKDLLQRLLPLLSGEVGTYEVIAFGVTLILLLQYSSQGLWGVIARAIPSGLGFAVTTKGSAGEQLAERPKVARNTTVLSVEAVRKTFGGLIAVNDVSFDVKAGEIVGLIGPNGAGKSTLFNLVSGALSPVGGSVELLGNRTRSGAARSIARLGVARSFQHVKMDPDMTVLANVSLGAHSRSHCGYISAMLGLNKREENAVVDDAWRQLKLLGLSDCGLRPGGSLALGQQRLMEISRALALDPVLLLLDEPAAGLRHAEKMELRQVLDQLRSRGLAILLVEHDMELVMGLADRLVVLDFGTKIAEGRPNEIRQNARVLEAYLGSAG